MIPVVLLVTAFVSVILVTLFIIYQTTPKGKAIPGLKPVDFNGTGNLDKIEASGSLHQFLKQLHQQYGPIASFWFGNKYTVSVASPDMLNDLKGVFDRPPELFISLLPILGSESIQFKNGEEGRKRRKATDSAFGHSMLRHFCENFNEIAEETVQTLAALPQEEGIPLCEHTMVMAIKGIAQTSFGPYFKSDEACRKLRYNYDVCFREMEKRLDGMPLKVGSDRQKKFDEALQTIKEMVKDIIKEKQQTISQQKAFIDILINRSDIYPESTLLADAISYMVGGFHNSGYLLAWTLYFLAKDEQVQEKLYQEVISVAGRSSAIGPKEIAELRYLKQVLNEAMRITVPAAFAAKVQDVDIQLDGYLIPKGTPVITAYGAIHQNENLWPLPDKFDPERFNVENVKGRHQFAFQPFGLPARRCPGFRFTYYELTVYLAILIRSFKWSLVEGQVIKRKYGLATFPNTEIWAQIKRRDLFH
ncbi:Cytochrome P450 20A1 [Holothuria leucospilota]|uniref:Cytochrome P450 20A1 n=1 Tax=Holothuria leucospilota TaxID=206669 RepID=A0A9Q0YRB0_HOLLE|nr:Cytochrome P450 20A1 [Holothuria leucospilota]